VKKTITVNRSLTLELLDKTPYQSFMELTILQYIAYMWHATDLCVERWTRNLSNWWRGRDVIYTVETI